MKAKTYILSLSPSVSRLEAGGKSDGGSGWHARDMGKDSLVGIVYCAALFDLQ